jgi:hypothetical protein
MLYTARTCSVISSAHACKCVHRICPDTRHSVQRTLSTDRSRFLSQDDRSIDDSYSTYGYQGRTVFGVSNGNPHVHVRRRQRVIYVQSVNACLMPCLIHVECDHQDVTHQIRVFLPAIWTTYTIHLQRCLITEMHDPVLLRTDGRPVQALVMNRRKW